MPAEIGRFRHVTERMARILVDFISLGIRDKIRLPSLCVETVSGRGPQIYGIPEVTSLLTIVKVDIFIRGGLNINSLDIRLRGSIQEARNDRVKDSAESEDKIVKVEEG